MDNLGDTLTDLEQIAVRLGKCSAVVCVAADELAKSLHGLHRIINDNPEAFAVPLRQVYQLSEKDHTPTKEHAKVAKD